MPDRKAEHFLLAEAVKRGAMDFLTSAGFSPKFFVAEHELAAKCWNHFTRHRKLPSQALMRENYPRVDWSPPDERDLEVHMETVRDCFLGDLHGANMHKALGALKEGRHEDMENILRKHLAEADQIRNPNNAVNIIKDPGRYNRYVEKARLAAEGVFAVPFAHPVMNEYLGGMQPGNLYCHVARPKVGKSISSDTEVLTPYGSKRIVDVEEGDIVMGYNTDGTVSPTTVLAKFDHGVQNVRDITHRGKWLAAATNEHRWLGTRGHGIHQKGEKHLRTDQLGGVNRIRRALVEIPCGDVYEPHAYAIGAMLGDGSLASAKNSRILNITSADPEIPAKIAEVLGYEHVERRQWSDIQWRIGVSPSGQNSRPTATLVEPIHHYEHLAGKDARHKSFPWEVVNTWSRESLLEFVAGLIDTDGCVQFKPSEEGGLGLWVSLSSCSPDLLELFARCIHKLYQIQPQKKYNVAKLAERRDNPRPWGQNTAYDREHGRVEGSVMVAGNLDSARFLKELSPHLVTERKQWREEYAATGTWQRKDVVGVSKSEPYLAQTWDIMVDNDTHLYLLANEGLITHNCIALGTLVPTPRGNVPIESLKPGSVVYGYNKDHSVSKAKVVEVHDRGVQEVVEIKQNGHVLVEATPDHRWLSGAGKMIHTREIKKAKELACATPDGIRSRMGTKLGDTRAVQTYDISIDNDTSLYLVTEHGIVTHNSFSCLLDAHNAWREGVEVLYVSLEMPRDQVGYRFDSLEGGFSSFNLNRGVARRYNEVGELIEDDHPDVAYHEYIRDTQTNPTGFHIISREDGPRITPEFVGARARELGVGLVVVDYIGIMDVEGSNSEERIKVTRAAAGLKQIAMEQNIPVLAPHQLNRAGEKGQVTLANFAESDGVSRFINTAMWVRKMPLEEREAEEGFQETGQYLVSYQIIGNTHGPEMSQFAWHWNFDNGHRTPLAAGQGIMRVEEESGGRNSFPWE